MRRGGVCIALAIIVPNYFKQYSDSASQRHSEGGTWAWVGLTTSLSTPGQVTFFCNASPLAGDEMLTLELPAGDCRMFGPVSSRRGISWTLPLGGCAVIWLTTKEQ